MGTLALSATSCSDSWLDQEPSTAVETDKVVNVLTDVEFLLNGIYNTMQDAYAYSGRLVYYADATGDDMQAYSATSAQATTICSTSLKTPPRQPSGPILTR